MEQRMSDQRSLRMIVIVVLAFALVVLVAALAGNDLRTVGGRPAAPAHAKLQLQSAPSSAVQAERAENGPKQCVGPHEIEGPLC